MAKILVFNNDTLKSKRHINYKYEMETFIITENQVDKGGAING